MNKDKIIAAARAFIEAEDRLLVSLETRYAAKERVRCNEELKAANKRLREALEGK